MTARIGAWFSTEGHKNSGACTDVMNQMSVPTVDVDFTH